MNGGSLLPPTGSAQALGSDSEAAQLWFCLGYEELRRMAEARLRREPATGSVPAAALVDEVWLRLGGDRAPVWRNRAHFFGAASRAMRRVLVDEARKRVSQRRGAGAVHVDIDAPDPEDVPEAAQRFLWVEEGLEGLAEVDPKAANIVQMRFFGGFSVHETARALGISDSTVLRHWKFAREWLRREFWEP